jgi:LysR family transcriptional regulator, regulator of gene expression of beta-lactamase
MPRLAAFTREHPFVDLRLLTHNNAVNQAADGLDFAIRFGDGAWHGTEADALVATPLAPLCSVDVAHRLRNPADLLGETLLRSYRADEWPRWFAAAGQPAPVLHGPVFDSSIAMAAAAMQGLGVALLPVAMFGTELAQRRLARPFATELALGQYWLTRLKAKPLTDAMRAFRDWALAEARALHGVQRK